MPVVCLMLKAPLPGLVKTRFAREVGDSEAVIIYRAAHGGLRVALLTDLEDGRPAFVGARLTARGSQ